LIIFDEISACRLKKSVSFKIYDATQQLPTDWDALALDNIFLSTCYFKVLEASAPENMTCFYIGFFQDEELVGIAISQFLNLNKLQSFGDRDQCIKTSVRNFVFKKFASHVLFMGNNMLTGQNSYCFSDKITEVEGLQSLKKASLALKSILKEKGSKIHLSTFKDFPKEALADFEKAGFDDYFQFSTQPNMVFTINEDWKSEQDYIDSLSKKYRDQYKRARKKSADIVKKKLHLEDIVAQEKEIYELYFHVAKNAPFNTFFLAKNHFSTFKSILKDKFLFYGYFQNGKLIGFNTLIKNGAAMDTYFLGYDDSIQRDKMLYLNMLYDMIAYSINKGFKKIIFARTALEIKSSVGAKPEKMYGFIAHNNKIIDKNMARLFGYLEPETLWQERNPFK